MKTPQEMIRDAEEKLAKAKADAEITANMLANLGDRPKPTHFHIHSYKEFLPTLKYEKEHYRETFSLEEVFALMDQFPVSQNYWILKDSCTSLTAESCCNPDKMDECGSMIGPVVIKIDSFGNSIEWSTMLGDKHYEIECSFPHGIFNAVPHGKTEHYGELVRVQRWDLVTSKMSTSDYQTIRWGSGDYSNKTYRFSVFFQPWQKLEDIKLLLQGKK